MNLHPAKDTTVEERNIGEGKESSCSVEERKNGATFQQVFLIFDSSYVLQNNILKNLSEILFCFFVFEKMDVQGN